MKNKKTQKEELWKFWESCRDTGNQLMDEADRLEAQARDLLLKAKSNKKLAKQMYRDGLKAKDRSRKIKVIV